MRVALVVLLSAAVGCGSENECNNYLGEFSQELSQLCTLGKNVQAINERTTGREICDITDSIQDTATHTFLGHKWILGGLDNHPIYIGFDDASKVYIPGKDFKDIQGMQCYRVVDGPKDPNRVYGCHLSDRLTGLTPNVRFGLVTAGAGFPPYLQIRYRTQEGNVIGAELGYPREAEDGIDKGVLFAILTDHSAERGYMTSCPSLDDDTFTNRVESLTAFAELLFEN